MIYMLKMNTITGIVNNEKDYIKMRQKSAKNCLPCRPGAEKKILTQKQKDVFV